MKKIRQGVLLTATAWVFLVAPMVNAEAAPLSDRQFQIVQANCLSAQSSMQQLHRSEAATRANRGRAYESVSNLMAALNSRIVLAKLNASTLIATTAEMEKKFTAFKDDYSKYYDALDTAIKLQCAKQPVTFYDLLTSARQYRAEVAADIKAINGTLDAYQKGVAELRTTFPVNGSSAQ